MIHLLYSAGKYLGVLSTAGNGRGRYQRVHLDLPTCGPEGEQRPDRTYLLTASTRRRGCMVCSGHLRTVEPSPAVVGLALN